MVFPQMKKWRRKEKKSGSYSSFFTVMISRGLGKVWAFNVSSPFLFWSAVVLVLYVIFSTVAISQYFSELKSNRVQLALLEQLQHEIEATKRTLYQARQRLKFLEDHISRSQGDQKKQAESLGTEMTNPVSAHRVVRENGRERPEKLNRAEPVVDIKNLTTKDRGGGWFSVKFRLKKIKPDGTQSTGYLFIIAANSKSDPPQFWTHPKAALKNGEPINYKHGQLFKVRNYRIIRGKFLFDSKSERPSFLKILVYDEYGELILKREFSIEEAQ